MRAPEGLFLHSMTVGPDAIDVNRHVNNLAYLRWMQDVAIEHSIAQGWGRERYVNERSVWVVRSHAIEYLHPAFEGDDLTLMTWVASFRASSCVRRYLFWRARDHRRVASAETLWVLVDVGSGHAKPVPSQLRAAFPTVEDEAIERVLDQMGRHSTALPHAD